MLEEKILQITPALPGWYIAYDFENGKICKLPIACWAIVECQEIFEGEKEEPYQRVAAITVDGQASGICIGDNDSPNGINMGKYLGIVAPGENMPVELIRKALPNYTHVA
mgnify:CR=1 FL=1